MDIILIAVYNLSTPLFEYSRNGITFNIGIARTTQTQVVHLDQNTSIQVSSRECFSKGHKKPLSKKKNK